MTNIVKNFFEKIGSFLDDKVLCYGPVFSFFFTFFNVFSRVTNFIFFNRLAYLVFVLYIGFTIRFNFRELHELLLGRIDFMEIPLNPQIFIFVFSSIMYLVVVLTFLAFSSKISSAMKRRYGEGIMSSLHYNTGTTTIATAAITAGMGVITMWAAESAETARVQIQAENSKELCRMQIEAWQKVSESCVEKKITPPSFDGCNLVPRK